MLDREATCRYIHAPTGWANDQVIRKTLLHRTCGAGAFLLKRKHGEKDGVRRGSYIQQYDRQLVSPRGNKHKYESDDLQTVSWGNLAVAMDECKRGYMLDHNVHPPPFMFRRAGQAQYSMYPNWNTHETCTSVYIPLGANRRTACVS